MKLPPISIIVVCFNEEKNINSCLRSLLGQNYPQDQFEIVIVDNASVDQTQETIQKFQSKDKRVRLIINPFIGIAHSRNLGLKKSRHPFVAFIDADCQAPTNWLRTLAENLVSLQKKNPDVIATGGPNLPPDKATFFQEAVGLARTSFLIHHGSVQGKTYDEKALVEHLPTVNVLYQKQPLLKINGFDENFGNIAEDLELSWRLAEKGYRFVFLPQASVEHQLDQSLISFLKKVFRYGKGRIWFLKKHPLAFKIRFLAPILILFLLTANLFTAALLPITLTYFIILLLAAFFLALNPQPQLVFSLFILFLAGHSAYAFGEIYGLLTNPHSKERRNVSLITLYKCGNVGDAAIFQTALQVLPEKYNFNQFSVLAFSPRGLLTKKVKLPLKKNQKARIAREFFDPSLKPRNQSSQFFKWVKCFFKTDDLIFWGGYWLHDYTWYNLPLILTLIFLAKMMRKKVILSGIGAGPFKRRWSKILLGFVLNRVDYLSIRDDFSLKSLKNAGVNKVKLSNYPVLQNTPKMTKDTSDDARLIQTEASERAMTPPRWGKKKKVIGFNLAAWFDIQNRWQFSKTGLTLQRKNPHCRPNAVSSCVVELLISGERRLGPSEQKAIRLATDAINRSASLINQIIEKNKAEIILLPSMFPEDVIVMKKIMHQVKQKNKVVLAFKRMPPPEDFQKKIASLDLLISMRLHPLIFAYLQDVPRIALVYDSKVKTFMKKMGEEKAVFSFSKLAKRKERQKFLRLIKQKLNPC